MKGKLVGQHLRTFTFFKVLGAGAWATVYEAIDDRDHGTVAIKVIPKKLLKETPKLQELIKTQIKVLQSCNNQNVIRFVDNFKTDEYIFIATEFCNGGDLQGYLQKKKNLSEDEATPFLKQILNGFKGLHEVGAMHRDFKVANVLLHNGVCKIADLGFAKQMQRKNGITRTVLGTSLTMAPQVLEEKPYGFEADIWSIGVVYYQMLFGKYPYTGMNDYDILKKIKTTRPDYSRVNISSQSRDFIERCLTVDPRKRISWSQLYEHPLLNNKQQANMIYGLKSKVSINQNKDFYKKNQLPQKNMYPDINNNLYDIKGVQFADVKDDIRQSQNINAFMKEVDMKKEKDNALDRYEKAYLNKRNNIMFIFKFVSPFIPNFNMIKANHGITMFILSKKAYQDMIEFIHDIENGKNIFNFPKYFEEFRMSALYKNILNQCKEDLGIIEATSISYRYDIQICSKEVEHQLDIKKVHSKNFNKLINQTVDQYWFMLAQALGSMKGDAKKQLIKVLQALYYYKENKNTQVQEFDRMMTVLDYQEAQKDIMIKYTKAFS